MIVQGCIFVSYSSRKFALYVVTAGLFSSCAAPGPRNVAFRAAEFSGQPGPEVGSIVGKAFYAGKSGREFPAHDNEIDLVPVNAYTSEIQQRVHLKDESLDRGDRRLKKYLRSARVHPGGVFEFDGVPPGDYYLLGWFVWEDSMNAEENIGSHPWGLTARVSVRNGETVHVSVTR